MIPEYVGPEQPIDASRTQTKVSISPLVEHTLLKTLALESSGASVAIRGVLENSCIKNE